MHIFDKFIIRINLPYEGCLMGHCLTTAFLTLENLGVDRDPDNLDFVPSVAKVGHLPGDLGK